jgi:hypothetical protein
VADGEWHFNSHYPTQANRRLEWDTQHLLPVWQNYAAPVGLNSEPAVLTQRLKPSSVPAFFTARLKSCPDTKHEFFRSP